MFQKIKNLVFGIEEKAPIRVKTETHICVSPALTVFEVENIKRYGGGLLTKHCTVCNEPILLDYQNS